MKADAIIFDKDGTLLDFDAFWVTVSAKTLEDVLKKLKREDIPITEILEKIGVHNGITDIDGVLCKGTYAQIGYNVWEVLDKYGCKVDKDEVAYMVTDAYNRNCDAGKIEPTCMNLVSVLKKLRERNKRLAIVTTDNEIITAKCLKELGIDGLFDKIYTDDGKTPVKPDPYCIGDFSKYTGIEKDEIVMVGDTLTDVKFARNAKIRVIGVAKNQKNKDILNKQADCVVDDVSFLESILE